MATTSAPVRTQKKKKEIRRGTKASSQSQRKNFTSRKKQQLQETDSTFFLKLVIFIVLGSQWVYIESGTSWQFPIPLGLIIGLVFATHEHFQIDRKIEYAVLLTSMLVSFWLPVGIVISV